MEINNKIEHLKTPLETYFKKYDKVRIVRAEKREGLIRARLLGIFFIYFSFISMATEIYIVYCRSGGC